MANSPTIKLLSAGDDLCITFTPPLTDEQSKQFRDDTRQSYSVKPESLEKLC